MEIDYNDIELLNEDEIPEEYLFLSNNPMSKWKLTQNEITKGGKTIEIKYITKVEYTDEVTIGSKKGQKATYGTLSVYTGKLMPSVFLIDFNNDPFSLRLIKTILKKNEKQVNVNPYKRLSKPNLSKEEKIEEKKKTKFEDSAFLNELMNDENNSKSLLFNKKEIKYLRTVLANGENVICAIDGILKENDDIASRRVKSIHTLNMTRMVVVVLTNKRVLYIDRHLLFGGDFTQILLSKIQSCSYEETLLKVGSLTIMTGFSGIFISGISSGYARKFSDLLNKELEKINSSESKTPVTIQNNVSNADELRKYKGLLDDGIITLEEYEKKKKELLGL